MRFFKNFGILALVFGLFCGSKVATAQESTQPAMSTVTGAFVASPLRGGASQPPLALQHSSIELVSETKTISSGTQWLGLTIKLDEGWHTYWKNAGDTGFGATFSWQLPEGFVVEDILWPTPEKIMLPPLVNYGYHKAVTALVKLKAPENLTIGEPYSFSVDASYLICEKVCLPAESSASLNLVAANAPVIDEAIKSHFDTVRNSLPQALLADMQVKSTAEHFYLVIPKEQAPALPLVFIPSSEDMIADNIDQLPYTAEDLLVLPIKKETYSPINNLEKLTGLLVSGQGAYRVGYRLSLPIENGPPPAAVPVEKSAQHSTLLSDTPVTTLWLALGFAFIAGLILNLMPCVLPVLALKVMSIVKHRHKGSPAKHAFVFLLGVMATFWALSLALIALKEGGNALGWGFHLQSPAFVGLLVLLLTLVALDFFGVFEVGTSLTQLENTLQDKRGYAESFMSGLLITLVATPCTVPFMGGAVSYGLSHGQMEAVAVFSAMGFGLALPYVLLSLFPRLLQFVPKPGAWMVTFKQFMGFPVLASALWLLWVFGNQTTTVSVMWLLSGLFCAAFGAWAYGKLNRLKASSLSKIIGFVLFAMSLIYAGLTAFYAEESADTYTPLAANQKFELVWQPWSKEAVNTALAENTPVLVNFTADWCITCKFNELTVFKSVRLKNVLLKNNVQLFVADWTSYDREITNELNRFGRSGVPLYVLYPQGNASEPVILPQLPSVDDFAAPFK